MAAVGLHNFKENSGAAHVHVVIGHGIFDALANRLEACKVDHCVRREFRKDALQKKFVSNIANCKLNVSIRQPTHAPYRFRPAVNEAVHDNYLGPALMTSTRVWLPM